MKSGKRIPLTIVTGFLGSGKTTLLREILARFDMANTLILMNEIAEIGIDDRLLKRVTDDTILLENGCVCCSVRDDLRRVLLGIAESPPADCEIQRIILETTGLADPRAFIATIVGTPVIAEKIELNGVITVIDCLNAKDNLAEFNELEGQLVMADLILLTKLDLTPSNETEAMKRIASNLNPVAIVVGWDDLDDLCGYLNGGQQSGALFKLGQEHREFEVDRHQHGHSEVVSFYLTIRETCDWSRFAIWLSMFVHAHGADILRIKGILYLGAEMSPVAINCVQHLVYFPEHLSSWPGDDRSSVLVFIVRGISKDTVIRSLDQFFKKEIQARNRIEGIQSVCSVPS